MIRQVCRAPRHYHLLQEPHKILPNPLGIKRLPTRADSERSWTVSRRDIEAKTFDLKAVNPKKVVDEDTRTPEELLDIIKAKGEEVTKALAVLRK